MTLQKKEKNKEQQIPKKQCCILKYIGVYDIILSTTYQEI